MSSNILIVIYMSQITSIFFCPAKQVCHSAKEHEFLVIHFSSARLNLFEVEL